MISTNNKGKINDDLSNHCDQEGGGQENSSEDKVRGYVDSYDASCSFGGPNNYKEGRVRARGRVTEFRSSRGGRGGRGRGAFPLRGERDPDKYQEPPGTSDAWPSGNSGKFYERPELVVSLPEDPRISKLLRRLCAEVDVEKSLIICSKLQEVVMLPENTRYIRRSYDILVESLLDVFYDGPGPEIKEGAAIVLGRIGYNMGPDFRKHLDWISTQYAAHGVSIRHLLTLSFIETLQLDLHTPNLIESSEITLEKLQGIIEATDSPDVFMAAINSMIIMSNSYPEHFANHFVDMVDILVGWHVDNTQPKRVKDFALQSLYKLSRHWQADVGFSINLLTQFIEDMTAYSSDLNQDGSSKEEQSTLAECMEKITAFVNVFNTVVKSLGNILNPNNSLSVSWNFLSESLMKILQVLSNILTEYTGSDLIVAGNESVVLLLDYLQTKSNACLPSIFSLITMELTHYLDIDENTCLSITKLICKVIKEVSSNLPIEFIIEIMGPESLLRPLRYSVNASVQKGLMSIYVNLLNLKNIPLLQETYKYVLTDIQNSYAVLVSDIHIINSEYREVVSPDDAEKNVIFYLQCLSDLANASNSIIGMWALQPSILELLAIKMSPHNEILAETRPALHYCILYLLYSHCKKNNHFIASSDLVGNAHKRANDIFGLSNLSLGDVSGSSPTSGHLAVILNILSIILEKQVATETLILILNWVNDIFHQLEQCLPIVSMTKVFLVLVTNIIALGNSFEDSVVILVIKNMQLLLQNKTLTWNIVILKNIAVLCLLHLDNNNKTLSHLCMNVLFQLPWDVVQLELDKQTVTVYTSKKLRLSVLNSDLKANSFKEYLMRGSFDVISNHQFKILMDGLLQPSFENRSFIINTFLSSWPLQSPDSDENNLQFFRQCARNFSSICVGWILSEIAQTTVSLKLRTPLGKPQETFMKIEGAFKAIARETSSLETKYVATNEHPLMTVLTAEHVRTRRFTEFMIFLEKYIQNAADGTAVALPPVAKPVKTFFHTNWPTCREWLSRVRPASLAVSLYAGHFGAAVYHAQLILKAAAANPSTNIDIEAITMSVAKALIKLREPEVLLGLYAWIKLTFDKKLYWLKAAAEQANSKHELAIEHYRKLNVVLEDEVASQKETKSNKFMAEQILESYKNVQNWEDMQAWNEAEDQHKPSQWTSFTALKYFDESDEIPEELCDWDILDIDSKEMPKNASSFQGLLNKIESSLVCTAVNMYYDENVEKYEPLLNTCDSLLLSSFEEFSRANAVHFLKDIAVFQLANHGLKNIIRHGKTVSNPFKPSVVKEQRFGTELENLTRILWWHQYFTKFNANEENMFYAECLRLDVIKNARKTSNVIMAKRELLKHFKTNSVIQMYLGNINDLDELIDALLVSDNIYDLDIWSLNNATALVELCKLTHEANDAKTRAVNLCASVSLGFSQRLAIGEQSYDLREKGTRMLLTLSKWVQNENENLLVNDIDSPLSKLVSALPEIGLVDNNISENVIPISDSAVGKLLQFSVNQCPGLAKAWANFASWCFRWGRKMVEFSSKTGEQLTDNDKMQIESVMIGCSPEDFEAVCEILSKTKATCDDEDIDWNEINTSEMIESQLRTVPSLSNAFPEHLALLVDIWRQAQKRVFSYFELSADAYFKFLQLICASDYINHAGEYAVVSATLRLLRLIVKHAMELQTVLESGLANTPTQPWKVIIPQLFSRLNHPEAYVRKCVSDLLCRLAEDTPHLITFPAVVGAVHTEQRDLDLGAARTFLTERPDDAAGPGDPDAGAADRVVNEDLDACFLDMVETLGAQAPETIQQVKLLVKELQRINLLWDELWLGALVQHHADFSKRLPQLEAEIAKVKNNANLTAEEKEGLVKEKHRIIFDPVVFVLEQLHGVTAVQPETPHEISFQTKFQPLITDAIDKLKNPPDAEKPAESWAPLKQLQLKLQQRVNRRTAYVLRMADISPTLAELRGSVIAMPGLGAGQRAARVTVAAVDAHVTVLPTKTRPKKLVLRGSDGRAYAYLFKGLEDLHLDERIMQLLSIANTMLARDSENNDNQTYRARHYSVVPLGPRSGLISWVEHATPLFALYKRWQHREAAALAAKTAAPAVAPRPSELFYAKLTPLLREAGVALESRKDWPAEALRRVLRELSAETPADLLWRELWAAAPTAERGWRSARRFSYSCAVMSVIGHVIGLGDRHLDNVLVDLQAGEVVHIDYNVCFEKGRSLRVPERVPFRLTPNLRAALGPTGVEGIFRLACEHVLRTLRRGRETLLTLLEAFVYDPLVEWGGGAGGGGGAGRRGRRGRDVRAALAMLAVRATEVRHDLAENTRQLLAALPAVEASARQWAEEAAALAAAEARLQAQAAQADVLRELEACPALAEHPLHAVSLQYSSYKQAKNACEDTRRALREYRRELDAALARLEATDAVLRGPQLVAWVQEYADDDDDADEPIFDHVKEFLANAGQASMIAQCEQAEAELKQSLRQTLGLIRACLEQLTQAVAVAQYFPRSQTDYHRALAYREWVTAVLDTDSADVCREVCARAAAQQAGDAGPAAAPLVLACNQRLAQLSADAAAAHAAAAARLQRDAGADAVAALQEQYREAKANVGGFLRSEDGAPAALEAAVLRALAQLNRRYLTLESGAQSAGDCLADLTSRDGEWFLDEMAALAQEAVELLSLLPLQSASADDAAIPAAAESVRRANLLLQELAHLNHTVAAVLLPEALQAAHGERGALPELARELARLQADPPLPDLLAQLDSHVRCLVMDMEPPATQPQQEVAALRARYEALPGAEGSRALLMGLNGLFAGVELRARELHEQLWPAAAAPPPAWRQVDQVIDSMHMAASLQSAAVRALLEDACFVRRVQCAAELFAAVAARAAAFRARRPAPPDDAPLTRPVRRFTASYVSCCVLGAPSRALAQVLLLLLRRARVDIPAEVGRRELGASYSIRMEALVPASGSRAAALVEAFVRVRRARARAAAAARGEAQARAAARAARLTHAAHCRLYAEKLGLAEAPTAALHRAGRQLAAAAERLAAAAARAATLAAAAHQRAVWGAGANPALAATARALQTAWRGAAARARARVDAARGLSAAAAPPRAPQRPPLARAATVYGALQRHALRVTPAQEALMELLHPDPAIDAHWVQNVSALLGEMSAAARAERARRAAAAAARRAAAAEGAARLRAPAAERARLLADCVAAVEVLAQAHETNNPARAWLAAEAELARQLQDAAAAGHAAAARAALPAHDDALLQLAQAWSLECGARRAPRPAPPAARARSECNPMGAGVWRRVRLKLEPRKPLAQQVDYIISEATSEDNLCMMYEGWMAWV